MNVIFLLLSPSRRWTLRSSMHIITARVKRFYEVGDYLESMDRVCTNDDSISSCIITTLYGAAGHGRINVPNRWLNFLLILIMLILFLFPLRDNINNITYLRGLYLLYIAHIYDKYIYRHGVYVFPKRQAEVWDYNRDGERKNVCMRDIKCIDITQYHFFIFSSVAIFKEDHISPRINSSSKGSSLNVRYFLLSFILRFPDHIGRAISSRFIFKIELAREKTRIGG